MSASKAIWLYCDGPGCGNGINTDGAGETVRAARKDAAEDGWHYTRSGKDICPLCWQDGER